MPSFAVNSGVTDTVAKTVANNDVGTIESGGTLSAATAITWTGGSTTPGVVIDNSGTISATTRAIDTSGAFSTGSITVNNNAGAIISASGNDAFRINTSISNGTIAVNNAGTITSGGGQAIDFNALASPLGQVTITNQATGIISAAAADAVRPGTNATIDNHGEIVSLGAGNDGIDFQAHTGGVINNFAGGSITGARHGITGDNPITLTNHGTVTGQLGSGINMDTASDSTVFVTNTGSIVGQTDGVVDGDAIDIDGLLALDNHGTLQALGSLAVGFIEAITMGGGTVNNFAGGTIVSDQRAINVDDSNGGPAFAAATIVNEGLIQGGNGEAIVIVGTFADTVTNIGAIVGSVSTSGGADVFNFHAGSSVDGAVDGGDAVDALNLLGVGNGTADELVGIEIVNVVSGDWVLGSEGFDSVNFLGTGEVLRLAANVLADGHFDGALTGFISGDVLGLQGIGLATSATLGADNVLTVAGGSSGPITLQFDPAHDYTGQVFVLASDGIGGTIVTVDEPPVFTSPASFTVAENGTAVGQVTAVDPEGNAFVFARAGGDDAAFFAIDAHTGALSFLVAPDFETPEDATHDNVYEVVVSATDVFGATSTQTISVTVSDVVELGQTITGGNGNDVLAGTTGDDTMSGGNGNDRLAGGDGNDKMAGGNGNDMLTGGRGHDALDGGNGNDNLDGGLGDDRLAGGNGTDMLDGGSGNDWLDGGNDNDMLFGGTGDDRLVGGNGNDVFDGAAGNDVHTGGNGNDRFLFEDGFGHDVITDLRDGDRIQFDSDVFANFHAVRAASQQVGSSVVITADADNTITLQHTTLSSLHASDFLFV
jgi:RTX calcium-binding nonapeptide repeat (4 copies)